MTVDEQTDDTMLLRVRPPLGDAPAGESPVAGEGKSADPADGTRPARTRPRWARVLAALLLAALGFGVCVSVRSNRVPTEITNARDTELVRILDDLDGQQERLRDELAALEGAKASLAGPGGRGVALGEARERASSLALLAGTIPAQGPGIEIVITDPRTSVDSAVLVDAMQELRGAGAEAMEINGVRVVVSTYVLDNPGGGILVDGVALTPPYRLAVIGDSHTLAQAVQIPGGVVDTVASRDGANAAVETRDRIEIRALRPLPTPRYARPAG